MTSAVQSLLALHAATVPDSPSKHTRSHSKPVVKKPRNVITTPTTPSKPKARRKLSLSLPPSPDAVTVEEHRKMFFNKYSEYHKHIKTQTTISTEMYEAIVQYK